MHLSVYCKCKGLCVVVCNSVAQIFSVEGFMISKTGEQSVREKNTENEEEFVFLLKEVCFYTVSNSLIHYCVQY